MDKMSDALKSVAMCAFKEPNAPQREEDLAIALFYAQVAWNEANGDKLSNQNIKQIRRQMGIPKKLPGSFCSAAASELLKKMIAYKHAHLADDDRIIVAVLFEDERLRVHWREAYVS